MNCLNYVSISFSAVTFAIGMRAAYYWMKASEVEPDPGWRTSPAVSAEDALKAIEPLDDVAKSAAWDAALVEAWEKSALLNKTAAKWTAWAVVFGTTSSLVGTLASSF